MVLLGAGAATLSMARRWVQQCPLGTFRVHVPSTMDALLHDEDVDNDLRITIEDLKVDDSQRGDKHHIFTDVFGRPHDVQGNYYLANFLQKLALAREAGRDTATISWQRIHEPPTRRTSRLIRERFWAGLTRRIDLAHLPSMLDDPKMSTADGRRYLYVPKDDDTAWKYYQRLAQQHPELNMEVVRLPENPAGLAQSFFAGRHGLLTLAGRGDSIDSYEPLPFIVPGGRFNEMYGWDSYFETLGLLRDDRVGEARAMVDHFVYQIEHYGKILNANRTYYLTRSQPPFLTSMVRSLAGQLPQRRRTRVWLQRVLAAAVKEYRNVWMNADHLTTTGLSRYWGTGDGAPPEVEPGHFDALFRQFAAKHGLEPSLFEEQYRSGQLSDPELDADFKHDRAMRESGHDTSYRLDGVAADLVTVDLNALLYKIERDVAELLEGQFGGEAMLNGEKETAKVWFERAEARRQRMQELMWDERAGMFFDWNWRTETRHTYESATTFYPMWAGLATEEQAGMLVEAAEPVLEAPGGLLASTERSRGPVNDDRPPRQWDYPNGWPPHQIIAWVGLIRYGYRDEADRLIYRWLFTITQNAVDYNGLVPEKYDVVDRTHEVFAEYGNVGTRFSYITKEGFGWMNASYQIGLSLLSSPLLKRLDELTPPEVIFGQTDVGK